MNTSATNHSHIMIRFLFYNGCPVYYMRHRPHWVAAFFYSKFNASWSTLVPVPRMRATPPVQWRVQTLHVSTYSQNTPSIRNHAWILLNPHCELLHAQEREGRISQCDRLVLHYCPQVGYPLKENTRNITPAPLHKGDDPITWKQRETGTHSTPLPC